MASGHLQDALASPCARQLSMDTRPSVCHPTSKKINFLKDVAFPKKRGVLSSRPSRWPTSSSRPTTPTSRPVRHIKTDDVHLTSRSARRSRSFLRHPPASSPPCLPLPFPSRVADFTRDPRSRTSRKPDDGARRDFACTSARPPDGALRKHSAPPSSTRKNGRHPWPCSKLTKKSETYKCNANLQIKVSSGYAKSDELL